MKHVALGFLVSLTLTTGSVQAAVLTWTFTAFGGGYDLTGYVTGYQGNGPEGGHLITGQFTINLDAAPPDIYGSTAMASYEGSSLNWANFSINELSFADLPGVTPAHNDQVYLFLPSTGARDTYQVFSSTNYEQGGRLSLPYRKLLLNTTLHLHAVDWLTGDALNQALSWTEDNPTKVGLVDGDYGQIDIYYDLFDQGQWTVLC